MKIQPLVINRGHGLIFGGGHALFALFLREQPFLYQGFRVNKIRISRKGGEGLVRGVPITGRTKGQNLPLGLSGLF